MGIEMTDKTGDPRGNDEIERAIAVIEKHVVKVSLKVPPELYVELICIRDGLQELIELRGLFQRAREQAKKRKAAGNHSGEGL